MPAKTKAAAHKDQAKALADGRNQDDVGSQEPVQAEDSAPPEATETNGRAAAVEVSPVKPSKKAKTTACAVLTFDDATTEPMKVLDLSTLASVEQSLEGMIRERKKFDSVEAAQLFIRDYKEHMAEVRPSDRPTFTSEAKEDTELDNIVSGKMPHSVIKIRGMWSPVSDHVVLLIVLQDKRDNTKLAWAFKGDCVSAGMAAAASPKLGNVISKFRDIWSDAHIGMISQAMRNCQKTMLRNRLKVETNARIANLHKPSGNEYEVYGVLTHFDIQLKQDDEFLLLLHRFAEAVKAASGNVWFQRAYKQALNNDILMEKIEKYNLYGDLQYATVDIEIVRDDHPTKKKNFYLPTSEVKKVASIFLKGTTSD